MMKFWNRLKRRGLLKWQKLARPQTVMLDGLRVFLGEYAKTEYAPAIYANRHEAHEREVVGRCLTQDDVVLELGAGLGLVSLACCQKIGADRVHVCEANPLLEPLLRQSFALNDFEPELIMGIASVDATPQPFFVSDRFIVSSRYEAAAAGKAVQLPAVSLPELLQRIRPTFLIVDIEGSEVDLADPRVDLSSVTRICVEIHPSIVGDAAIRRLLAHLATQGFEVAWSECRDQVLLLVRAATGAAAASHACAAA